MRQCCVRHDAAYDYGGSRQARVYSVGVRAGGHPRFRRKHVSWGFGGARFRYDPEPAIPETPEDSGP